MTSLRTGTAVASALLVPLLLCACVGAQPYSSRPGFTGRATTPIPRVGSALDPVAEGAGCPFKNIMRCALPFSIPRVGKTNWNIGTDGYVTSFTDPGHIATTTILAKIGTGNYPTGSYVLLFDGSGTVSVGGDANPPVSATGTGTNTRLAFTVPSATPMGIHVTVNATTAGSHVTNIRVGLVADESAITTATSTATADVFDAAWLSLVSEFDILFLPHWQREWRNTYDDNAPSWSARPQLASHVTQATDAGVSHDAAVLLAAAANVDLWIAAPWNCDDAYMRSLASFYAQSAAYTSNASKKLYVTDSTHVLYLSDVSDRVQRHKRLHAAFVAAFGAERMAAQVRIVLDCSVCANYFEKLNHFETTTFDAEFRAVISAVATPAMAVAGNSPWQETQPNPYYHKLAPYVSDAERIAREELWAEDGRTFQTTAWLNMLGIPHMAYNSGISNEVPAFGHRFRIPNNTLAAIEGQLETSLRDFELSNARAIGDLTAEWAERWYRNGGSTFIAGKAVSYGIDCDDATTHLTGMNRLQCGFYGLTRTVAGAASSQRLRGLREWRRQNMTLINAVMRNEPLAAPRACAPACVWGDCVEGTCQCHSGYTGADCSTFDETKLANRCSPSDYAVGVTGLPDWTTAWAWTDMARYSRRWVHQPVQQIATQRYGWIWSFEDQHNRTAPDLRDDGFPRQLAPNDAFATFQRRDVYEYDHGAYHLFFDGDGIIETGLDTHIDRRVRQGHYILELKPVRQLNNGLYYRIIRTNPDDPIRNVRIVHASMLNRFQTQPFHPLFVRSMQEYKHVRFMNVMLAPEANYTNSSLIHGWGDRPTPDYYSQTVKGMAAELIVQLANTLHAKPWLNVPFHATDDYVRSLAQLVRRSLNPRLFPVTVEYSNEVWADHHGIGYYAQDRAIAAGIADGTDVTRARSCWVQRRSREIWRIFAAEQVSVHRVLGGQAVYTRPLEEALSCEANVADEVDTLIIAPYLGESLEGPDAIRTADEVFNMAPLTINRTLDGVRAHAALAARYGNKGLGTYEAGPAYFGGARPEDPDIISVGEEIHRSPRMATLLDDYFTQLRQAGSATINAYFVGPAARWGRYGAWGMREYQNQDPSIAYKAQGFSNYARRFQTCDPSQSTVIDQSIVNPPAAGCPNGCSEHGWCMRDGTCQCHWGFNGTDCSNAFWIPDTQHCNRYTCAEKNGTCEPVGRDGVFRVYQCRGCSEGWGGWHCHVPMCPRVSNCSWNGKCTAPNTCTCHRGHMGPDCSTDCGCNAHGSCNTDGTCRCDAGFRRVGGECVPACDCDTCVAPGVCGCTERCVYGYCWNGTCNCWSGFSGPQCTQRVPTSRSPNHASTMGIGLSGVSDWASSIPFVNYMWRSRDWIVREANELQPSTRWALNEKVSVTEEGYPAMLGPDRVASTFAMRDTESYIRAGRYHVYYDGEGEIEFGFDAEEVEGTHGKGYVLVDYRPTTIRDNGFFITIRKTNPRNPLRNIRILPPWAPHPAFFSVMPFTEEFLADLRPFRSIRFYGWQGLGNSYSNGSAYHTRTWANRKRLFASSMAYGHGVNEDLMIHLCNLLGAEPWFTIPHDASDDYVTKFATLIKRRLRPDVMVHIEHSNEVWNTAFESYKYAAHHGGRTFPNDTPRDAAIRWHGRRSQEIWTIFRRVFGAAQASRLKFQLGTWVISPATTALAASEITIRPVTVAVTTYFCGESTFGGEAASQVLSTAQLVEGCRSAVGSDATYFARQRAVAATHGFESELSAYEGGPSLVQWSAMMGGYPRPGVFERFSAFHRDAGMRTILPSYFDGYKSAGVSMVMYFTSAAKYSIYGSWGIKESTRAACSEAPKCAGVTAWMAANTNASARRVTWGMHEYGTRNTVRVTFDRLPTTRELETSARNLESRLSLPVFSVTAVVDDAAAAGSITSTVTPPPAAGASSTSRRLAQATSSSTTVLFIVSEASDQATNTTAAAAQLQAALASTAAADLGLAGYTVTNAAVEAPSDIIAPDSPLPPDVTNAAPAGGYSAPPPALGVPSSTAGTNGTTPATTSVSGSNGPSAGGPSSPSPGSDVGALFRNSGNGLSGHWALLATSALMLCVALL